MADYNGMNITGAEFALSKMGEAIGQVTDFQAASRSFLEGQVGNHRDGWQGPDSVAWRQDYENTVLKPLAAVLQGLNNQWSSLNVNKNKQVETSNS